MRTGRLLEDIKSKIDIVDFISGYVQLKKSGQNWKGLCPFHAEKTPSFMVNPGKQIFHCFGCGVGGDVIAFASKFENLSFNETIHQLAKRAGLRIDGNSLNHKAIQKEEKLRAALLEASGFFAGNLQGSVNARKYCEQRGITEESVARFHLGYALPGWNTLLNHLRAAGYSDSVIRESGLAVNGSKGLYDMFRQRLMFPITSMSGTVIAFGGRSFDNTPPKYINSPETEVFRKSDTLYGLSSAKEEIRRKNAVIIVEGYIDVIVCYQFGFKNVVAPLGTSLTPGQVQKLKSLTGNAVLLFDGDAAGKAAARRALSLMLQSDYHARVLMLPENEDPDSYLQKKGPESFEGLFQGARTAVEFLLAMHDGEMVHAAREALSLIADVKDTLLAESMLVEVADRTRMHESSLREEYRRLRNRGSRKSPQVPLKQISAPNNSEEYLLLSALISFPAKAEHVLERLDLGDIRDLTVRSLLGKIVSLGEKGLSEVLDRLEEGEKNIVAKLVVDPGFDLEHADANIEDCLKRINGRKLEERMRLAERSGDLNLINSLLREKKKTLKESGP